MVRFQLCVPIFIRISEVAFCKKIPKFIRTALRHFAKKSQNLSKRVMRDLGVLSGVLLFAIVNYIITTLAQIHKLLISRLIICPHCPLHCVHFLSINLLPCYSPRNNMLKIFCVSRLLYFWIPDLESRHNLPHSHMCCMRVAGFALQSSFPNSLR